MKKSRSAIMFLSGFFAASVFFVAMMPTFAASVMQQIYVNFDPVKIIIDGQEKAPPDDMKPMLYNGRTYVALRYVGEALGKEVAWEEATRTIRIGAPAARISGWSESFTDGPLSSNWDKVEDIQIRFDGPNGMFVEHGGALDLAGVLPDAMCNYTVEFDAAGDGYYFDTFIGKTADNEYTDGIALDGYARLEHNRLNIVYLDEGAMEKGKYYSIKLQVKNKQVDVYIDGEYITSQKLEGTKSAFAFRGGSFYVKNFNITVN